MYANFVKVAAACRSNGGNIAIEWPRGCSYWTEKPIQDLTREYGLINYDFDGCEYGLRSTAAATPGRPIRKPWRIASDMPEFASLRRLCTHDPNEHARCAGDDTKRTEGYTDELALLIHRCFGLYACSQTLGGSALHPEFDDDTYAVDF